MDHSHSRNYLMLLFCSLLWGVAFVAQSVGMDYMGPHTFNMARFWVGALVLMGAVRLFDRLELRSTGHTRAPQTPAQKRTLLRAGLLCGVFLALASAAQQVGIQTTTVGKAGFLTALYIVLVPILGILVGKRPGAKLWAGVLLAVGALYLLCMNGESFSIARGDALMLLCAGLFTFQIMTVDRYAPLVDGVRLSCLQFLTAAVFSTICAFCFEQPSLAAILAGWAPVLYAGVFSCGVAYTLQILGQRNADPSVASLIMSLESVFSVLAGWVLLGQTLTGRELAGCGLMFGAVVLAQLPSRKKALIQG